MPSVHKRCRARWAFSQLTTSVCRQTIWKEEKSVAWSVVFCETSIEERRRPHRSEWASNQSVRNIVTHRGEQFSVPAAFCVSHVRSTTPCHADRSWYPERFGGFVRLFGELFLVASTSCSLRNIKNQVPETSQPG
jgi:hypothetical protein